MDARRRLGSPAMRRPDAMSRTIPRAACAIAIAISLAQGPVVAAPIATAASSPASAASAAERRNRFGDPILPATRGLPGCPVPEGPMLTQDEARAQAHGRVERGTSCYRSGRCRLPNAYLYDREIAPRVVLAIGAAGGFEDTSVWVEVQRRWVWLEGCVARPEQAEALERLVRQIDDVEQVVPELQVGARPAVGGPPYRVAP
jgi:hypothetical protein